MPYRKFAQGAYSSSYATDLSQLIMPSDRVASSSSRAIIYCHGRNGDATQTIKPPIQPYTTALADAGYTVLGVDHARINSWGDPDANRALDDAYTYVTTTLGISHSKVGLMGWSMGGTTSLSWLRRNSDKVACAWLWNPVTDIRFFRDASGAYTPAYPTAPATATQGVWTSEINSTFAPSTTTTAGYTIPAAGGTGITMNVASAKSFADGVSTVGLPTATVNSREFTYTGKTDTSLIGCLATTGTTITVASSAAVTGTYTTQSNGYRVADEVAVFAGFTVPVRICQASDDTVVPPGQNNDATNGFVARVSSAFITRRDPSPTGGHILGINTAEVPTSEVLGFYTTNLPLGV